MQRKYNYVIINSAILFTIASILEMTMHECGHFIAAIMVGAKGISLHHNYVSNEDQSLPLASTLVIKGMGPLVSLMIGILFHYLCKRISKRNLTYLFVLYMSVFGYIGFFGYLMIAPFFTEGDTGYIFYALGFPAVATFSIAAAGGILLYLLMRDLTPSFVGMGTEEIINNQNTRQSFIASLIMFPLFSGLVITTLLNLPIPTWLSLIAPICSPFTLFWTYHLALSKKYPGLKYNEDLKSINVLYPGLLLILFVVILMNRLLVYGIYWN